MVSTRRTGSSGVASKRQRHLDAFPAAPAKNRKQTKGSPQATCISPIGDKENTRCSGGPEAEAAGHGHAQAVQQSVRCRAEEVSKLEGALTEALTFCQGQSVYIPGQPGTGKTHTVRQVLLGLDCTWIPNGPPAVALINCQDRKSSPLGRVLLTALWDSAAQTAAQSSAQLDIAQSSYCANSWHQAAATTLILDDVNCCLV
jgi:hypothetical protein